MAMAILMPMSYRWPCSEQVWMASSLLLLLPLIFSHIGIKMSPGTLADFMTTLTASPHSHLISFTEFRDFLLLLPRKASTREIYRYYEVRRSLDPDHRGAARVNMEGMRFFTFVNRHMYNVLLR
jgi:hypothetical protein